MKCVICGKKKPLFTIMNLDATRDAMVLGRWYTDQKGLDHYIAACLDCGTIHDCVSSFGFFLGAPWKPIATITSKQILEDHKEKGVGSSLTALITIDYGIPLPIYDALADSGHLPREILKGV